MIKILIKNLLHFDTGNFVNGEQKGRGYYFKNEYISKYKSFLVDEMRKRMSYNYTDENKKKFKDEWMVIHYFSEITTKAIKRTNEKKKPYYEELRRATELGKMSSEIEKLRYKITKLEKEKVGLESLKKTYEDNIIKMQSKFEEMQNMK